MKVIPISAGYNTLVDDDDYEELSVFTWTALVIRNRAGEISIVYAWRWTPAEDGPKRKLYMHRHICGVSDRVDKVDHKDHDGLNNRRANLRVVRHGVNLWNSRRSVSNTSGYKGVTWYKNYDKWMAQIVCNGRRRCLGYFTNIEDAAEAYRAAALELFGDFAQTGQQTTQIGEHYDA